MTTTQREQVPSKRATSARVSILPGGVRTRLAVANSQHQWRSPTSCPTGRSRPPTERGDSSSSSTRPGSHGGNSTAFHRWRGSCSSNNLSSAAARGTVLEQVVHGPLRSNKAGDSVTKRGGSSRQVIERIGGASRDRTDDLIVANDALSQLSYSPTRTPSFYQPLRGLGRA